MINKPNITEQIVSCLSDAIPELKLVYLFGSQVSGGTTKDSDIDIAFLAQAALDPVKKHQLSLELANLFEKDVDLIDLKSASTVLIAQVLETGKVLFVKDKSEQAYFEMYALSDYARLNEERRGILADFYRA